MRGAWWFAAVQPQGKPAGTWVLPKGLIDEGETTRETAVREVFEETGLRTLVVDSLGDTRYAYTWGGEQIFKVVSFFLLRPLGGRIGAIAPEMEVEVASARWLRLDHPSAVAFRGERDIVQRALEALGPSSHPSR
jgi:8-oxo-dGTP pyrophosphatase MutT (NUDIX family)